MNSASKIFAARLCSQVYLGQLYHTIDVAIKVVTTPTPAQRNNFVKEIVILKVRMCCLKPTRQQIGDVSMHVFENGSPDKL